MVIWNNVGHNNQLLGTKWWIEHAKWYVAQCFLLYEVKFMQYFTHTYTHKHTYIHTYKVTEQYYIAL